MRTTAIHPKNMCTFRGEICSKCHGRTRIVALSSRHRPLSLVSPAARCALTGLAHSPASSHAPQPGFTLPMQRTAAPSN
jgi:hypothetical protein